jgi:hypothetical protein
MYRRAVFVWSSDARPSAVAGREQEKQADCALPGLAAPMSDGFLEAFRLAVERPAQLQTGEIASPVTKVKRRPA